jgi:hypothetical protein
MSDKVEEATRYAENLAHELWKKHWSWRTTEQNWKPVSGDLVGLLTQIDNLTAGLVVAEEHMKGRLEKLASETFDGKLRQKLMDLAK